MTRRATGTTLDQVYAEVDGHPLYVDLQVPAASSPPPLVLWIHGGGWRQGSYKNNRLAWLAEHGYATASISYRFARVAIFPAQIHDCKGAVRWLRANAGRFGYDAGRLAAAGGSAGAHLAMLLGTSAGVAELEGTVGGHLDQSSAVSAVIQYAGPTDFLLRARTQPDSATSPERGSFALLNGPATGHIDLELARLASPATYVSAASAPLLSFQGLADDKVLPDQAERIDALYRQHGRPHELYLEPDAGHGAPVLFAEDKRPIVLDFLRRYL